MHRGGKGSAGLTGGEPVLSLCPDVGVAQFSDHTHGGLGWAERGGGLQRRRPAGRGRGPRGPQSVDSNTDSLSARSQ